VSTSPKNLSALGSKSSPPPFLLLILTPWSPRLVTSSYCCPRALTARPPCLTPASAASPPPPPSLGMMGGPMTSAGILGPGRHPCLTDTVLGGLPLVHAANGIEVEFPRVADVLVVRCYNTAFSRTPTTSRWSPCASPTYVSPRIVTTPLSLTCMQIQASMYGVIQTFNSWSKYPYLLFPSSLFFLIFRAFIVEFLICDLVEI
jgi:hypothetical protein